MQFLKRDSLREVLMVSNRVVRDDAHAAFCAGVALLDGRAGSAA
jgi:hypothetical protein